MLSFFSDESVFPDYLEVATSVVVPRGVGITSPRTSIYNVVLTFFSFPGPSGISSCDGSRIPLKDKDYCQIEIIKGLTDKGQFQYLTKLMGPQEGTYLYATQFHSLR